jgi:hypothetical protein
MVAAPIYFEESWAILSTIGLINTINGLVVVGITGLSPVTIVPITVSAAAAIANGLCYYAFYADYNLKSTLCAAAFADVFWLVSIQFIVGFLGHHHSGPYVDVTQRSKRPVFHFIATSSSTAF